MMLTLKLKRIFLQEPLGGLIDIQEFKKLDSLLSSMSICANYSFYLCPMTLN